MAKESRNSLLARGIQRYGKAAMSKKRGTHKYLNKGGPAKSVKAVVEAPKSRYYEVDVAPKPLKRRFTPKAAKLRASITPGTVLILLAGRFRGKRVVFLKQLASGLLLVSGTFMIVVFLAFRFSFRHIGMQSSWGCLMMTIYIKRGMWKGVHGGGTE